MTIAEGRGLTADEMRDLLSRGRGDLIDAYFGITRTPWAEDCDVELLSDGESTGVVRMEEVLK